MPDKRSNQHRIDAATVEVLAAWRVWRGNPDPQEAELSLRFALVELDKSVQQHAPELLGGVERTAKEIEAVAEKAVSEKL